MQLFQFVLSWAYGGATIPNGFITDFASVPREVWAILSPDDPTICYPSARHDFRYSCGGTEADREAADAELRDGMLECGASHFIAEAVYLAVRQFGGSHWATRAGCRPP